MFNWQWLLQTVLMCLALYIFSHDFEKANRPYLSLRYFLTWLFYGILLAMFLVLLLGFSIPLRLFLTGQTFSGSERFYFSISSVLLVAGLILVVVCTRILIRRRRYYKSVKGKK